MSTIEKLAPEDAYLYYCEQHSRYDAEAEAMRRRILDAPDTLKAKGGKTYYISYKGDDANDGLTPATAWRTVRNLRAKTPALAEGDLVLFERGGVYHDAELYPVSHTGVGAYGEGRKPQLYAGDKNYADPTLWEQVDGHYAKWRTKIPADRKNADAMHHNIGNIIFDHGYGCAADYKRLAREELSTDFDFYHDMEENYLYLYYSMGNPGAQFESIEMAPKYGIIVIAGGNEDITVENLCCKYTGGHAIFAYCGKGITVRGCEIGYIGGSMQTPTVRYGNGIEFYSKAENMLVENCWIYECFDAGYTNQSAGDEDFGINITVRDNLIEYCNYNIELWMRNNPGKSGLKNCLYSGNILRFAGYGFGTKRRIGSNSSAVSNFSMVHHEAVPCENVVIENNLLDGATRYLLYAPRPNDTEGRGPTVRGNRWNFIPYRSADTVASVGRCFVDGVDTVLTAATQEETEACVRRQDTAPADITFN